MSISPERFSTDDLVRFYRNLSIPKERERGQWQPYVEGWAAIIGILLFLGATGSFIEASCIPTYFKVFMVLGISAIVRLVLLIKMNRRKIAELREIEAELTRRGVKPPGSVPLVYTSPFQ